MKTSIFFFVILFACKTSSGQQIDSMAKKVIESNLKVVGDYLDKKESSLQKISDAIICFTDLTGIPSESDGTYYAQFHPTRNDLKAWTKWYELNKEYLFWDKEIKSIILYKKVKPGIF